MQIYFKEDKNSNIWLQFSNSIRIINESGEEFCLNDSGDNYLFTFSNKINSRPLAYNWTLAVVIITFIVFVY